MYLKFCNLTLDNFRKLGNQNVLSIYIILMCLVTESCLTLCGLMDYSLPGSSIHGNSPGKSTGVDCHFLLQRIFPKPVIEPTSPALQASSLPPSHLGSPCSRLTVSKLVKQFGEASKSVWLQKLLFILLNHKASTIP